MATNEGSEDSQTARQPSRTQFGKGLAEDIRERGDRRNITFDALRGKLVIDGGESIDINNLYEEFMAEERHKRSLIRQRFLSEWKKQMPAVPLDLATQAARNIQEQLTIQQLNEASLRREQNPDRDAEYDPEAALRRLLSEKF